MEGDRARAREVLLPLLRGEAPAQRAQPATRRRAGDLAARAARQALRTKRDRQGDRLQPQALGGARPLPRRRPPVHVEQRRRTSAARHRGTLVPQASESCLWEPMSNARDKNSPSSLTVVNRGNLRDTAWCHSSIGFMNIARVTQAARNVGAFWGAREKDKGSWSLSLRNQHIERHDGAGAQAGLPHLDECGQHQCPVDDSRGTKAPPILRRTISILTQ